jgi:hypothetical protein
MDRPEDFHYDPEARRSPALSFVRRLSHPSLRSIDETKLPLNSFPGLRFYYPRMLARLAMFSM